MDRCCCCWLAETPPPVPEGDTEPPLCCCCHCCCFICSYNINEEQQHNFEKLVERLISVPSPLSLSRSWEDYTFAESVYPAFTCTWVQHIYVLSSHSGEPVKWYINRWAKKRSLKHLFLQQHRRKWDQSKFKRHNFSTAKNEDKHWCYASRELFLVWADGIKFLGLSINERVT